MNRKTEFFVCFEREKNLNDGINETLFFKNSKKRNLKKKKT